MDAATVKRAGAAELPADSRLKLEYLEVVDPDDFQPVSEIHAPVVAAGALWVGTTRLIDNMTCAPIDRDRLAGGG